MPRRPRWFLPNQPLHVIQRGNNRQACFFADEDYRFYLDWLLEGARRYGCDIHAWVLMTNHVHLLLTPRDGDAVSRLMQSLGRRYVQYVNRTYRRSGTLWEGRFKASAVQAEDYLLRVYRYIELNPVRAGMVTDPSEYRWSSYRCNGLGVADALVAPHERYLALGLEADERRAAYRGLFRSELETEALAEVRTASNGGLPLGSERFRAQIAATLGARLPGPRGRPRKEPKNERGDGPIQNGLDL